jgi:hypothetical protein
MLHRVLRLHFKLYKHCARNLLLLIKYLLLLNKKIKTQPKHILNSDFWNAMVEVFKKCGKLYYRIFTSLSSLIPKISKTLLMICFET